MRQPPEKSEIGRVRSVVEKPRPLRISAALEGSAVGADRIEVVVDFRTPGAADRPRFQRLQEIGAARVERQHGVDQVLRRGGDFLVDRGDTPGLGRGDFTAARLGMAEDQLEQGRLADAVQPDQARLGARCQGQVGVVEEAPAIGVVDQIGDLKHG